MTRSAWSGLRCWSSTPCPHRRASNLRGKDYNEWPGHVLTCGHWKLRFQFPPQELPPWFFQRHNFTRRRLGQGHGTSDHILPHTSLLRDGRQHVLEQCPLLLVLYAQLDDRRGPLQLGWAAGDSLPGGERLSSGFEAVPANSPVRVQGARVGQVLCPLNLCRPCAFSCMWDPALLPQDAECTLWTLRGCKIFADSKSWLRKFGGQHKILTKKCLSQVCQEASSALMSGKVHGGPASDLPLRKCQEACLEACLKGARVIEMACGTGKTRVMRELAEKQSGKVVVQS